ncbi:MAG: phage terminase small subunit [Motiliproteus sp.]
MASLMRQHQAKVKKQQAEAQAKANLDSQEAVHIETLAGDYNQFQLLLNSLESDIQRLSGLSLEDKTALKRDELVPRYQPVVQAYIEACVNGEEPYKNPVLVELIVWLFDIGEVQQALDLAYIAIDQEQESPERFKSTLHTLVVDQVWQWAELQINNGDPVEPYMGSLIIAIVDREWVVKPASLSRLYKFAGKAKQKTNEPSDLLAALEYFKTAQRLDPKRSQVKTVIEKLEKALEKQPPKQPES